MNRLLNHKMMFALLMAQSVAGKALAQVKADSLVSEVSRTFVVVNIETGVPVRDILVYTDDGQEARTNWDGTFTLHEGYGRLTFSHPAYEKRIMLPEELDGDTIQLIPNQFALREVVIYGKRRDMDKERTFAMSSTDVQLMQSTPQGFNPLGLLALGYDAIWGKKIRHRHAMKEQKRKMIMDNY